MTEIKLPYNVEAEAGLLGAILIDNRTLDLVGPLTDEHFYEPLHGRIFARARAEILMGKSVNGVTLKPYFENDEAMKSVGGVGYLGMLTGSGAGLIGAKGFAKQIYDLAILRDLVQFGSGLAERAMDTSESIDPEALIEEAQGLLQRLYGSGSIEAIARSALEAADEVMAEWDQPVIGVSTGCIPEIDRALGPLRPGKLSVVAGRPGAGKTAFEVSCANGVARRGMDPTDPQGGGVLIVSHEMRSQEIGGRLIADTSYYGAHPLLYERIEGNQLDTAEREQVRRIRDGFANLPLEIFPLPTVTVPALRALVRRRKAHFQRKWGVPLRLLLIDYLQLMTGTGKGKSENRTGEISEISRGLKQIAMEEDVHVMALSQLSRALESREDKRPRLNDLRESGSIEQDADIVVGLYSDVYYHEQKKPDPTARNYQADLVEWHAEFQKIRDKIAFGILKRRNGRAQYWIEGRFYREHQAVRGMPT